MVDTSLKEALQAAVNTAREQPAEVPERKPDWAARAQAALNAGNAAEIKTCADEIMRAHSQYRADFDEKGWLFDLRNIQFAERNVIDKLKAAGFVETTYTGQGGIFWKKILLAREMPYVREHLVGSAGGLDIDDDDECFVEVVPGNEVQMGVPAVDYHEEPVSIHSDEGRGLLRDAGVAI